jgi:hypothetical protein
VEQERTRRGKKGQEKGTPRAMEGIRETREDIREPIERFTRFLLRRDINRE